MSTRGRPFSDMVIGLSLDGAQFNGSLKSINQSIKVAESQMRSNLKIIGNAEKSYDDLAQTMNDMNDVYTLQQKKMQSLRRQYEYSVELHGENSKEAKKFAAEINNLAGTLAGMDRQMQSTKREMIYLEEGVEDVKKAMSQTSKQSSEMAKALKDAGRTVEAAAEEQADYARQLAQTEELMKRQERVVARMAEEFGENSQEVQKARQSYENLANSARNLEIRLDGATDRLREMGVEGAEANAQLQREMTQTTNKIKELERAMQGMDTASDSFREAESELQRLRSSLSNCERQAESTSNAIREIGRQNIDTSNVTEAGGKFDSLREKAQLAGAAITAALAMTGAGVIVELDQAITKMGQLSSGLDSYRKSLRQGVVDAGYTRQADVFGIQGNGEISGAKRLENVGTLTGFDANQVGKAMNLLMTQFKFDEKGAEELLIKSARQGLENLDEMVEYLGAQQVSDKLGVKGANELADYMITGAMKAIQSGGARHSDLAFDFYNEMTVRAYDDSQTQRDKFIAAGGEAGGKAHEQFLDDNNIMNFMKNMDAAIKAKWDTPERQRKAWIESAGTQGEGVNLDGIQQLVNGDIPMTMKVMGADGKQMYDDFGRPVEKEITGQLMQEEKELLAAKNNLDELVGSIKELGVTLGLQLVSAITKVVDESKVLVDTYGVQVVDAIESFMVSFKDGFSGMKEIFEPVTSFMYDKLYVPIAEMLGMDTSNLASAAASIGAVVGALSALALINLPLKALGMVGKMFGAKGAISTFLSGGVLGKAGMILGATGKGVGKVAGAAKEPARALGGKIKDKWNHQMGSTPLGIVPQAGKGTHAVAKTIGTGLGKTIKGAKGLAGGIAGLAGGMAGGPVGMLAMSIPLVIPLVKQLYDNFEPFKNIVDGTAAKLKEFWAWLQPMLIQAGQWIKEKLVLAWEDLAPKIELVSAKLTQFWTWLQPMLIQAGQWIKEKLVLAWDGLVPKVEFIWSKLQQFWAWLSPMLVQSATWVKNSFSMIWTTTQTIFTNVVGFVRNGWTTISTAFSTAKDFLVSTATAIWSNVSEKFSSGFNFVKEKAIGFKDTLVSNFTKIKDGIVEKVTGIISSVKEMPGKIADGLRNAAGAVKSAATSMMNGMISGVESGINRVIGGVNTALGWFGVSKKISTVSFGRSSGSNVGSTKKNTSGAVPTYHKGTTSKSGHPGGPAVVNDAKGSNYQELIMLPTGESFVPKGRNVTLDLPKGTHVLDGKRTKDVLKTGHVPHYAKGTTGCSCGMCGIAHYASGTSGAWDWAKEKVMGGVNWVTEKINSLKDVKQRVIDFVAKKITFSETNLSDKMVKGLGNKMIEGASNLIWSGKKNLDQSETGGIDGVTGKYTGEGKSAGALANLIAIVRNIMSKYPGSRITSTLRPGARTAAGTLSDHALGKAVDVGGHGQNGSPTYYKIAEDFMRLPVGKYAIANNRWAWKNRHGWKGYPYGGHLNHVHLSAYKNGGFINKPTLGMVGEAGPEAIIPMSKALRTRGLSLLHETARSMGYEVEEKPLNNEAVQEQSAKLDKMIELLTLLLDKDPTLEVDGVTLAQVVDKEKKRKTIKENIARGIM